jgi:hypothetical protein
MSGLAVIFGFCTLLAGTQDIITSRGEHRGPNLIFMSFKQPPPSASIKIFNNILKFWVKANGQKTIKSQKSVINPL